MNPLQQQLQQLEQQLLQNQQMFVNVRGNLAAEQQLTNSIGQLQQAIHQIKLQLQQGAQQFQQPAQQYQQPAQQYQQPTQQYQQPHQQVYTSTDNTTTNLGSNSKYRNRKPSQVQPEQPQTIQPIVQEVITPVPVVEEPKPITGHEFEPLAIGNMVVEKEVVGNEYRYNIKGNHMGNKLENIVTIDKEWSTFDSSEVGTIPTELKIEMKFKGIESNADIVICEASFKRSCVVEAGNTGLAMKMYNSEDMSIKVDSLKQLILRLVNLKAGNPNPLNDEFFNIVIKDITTAVNGVLVNTVNSGLSVDNILTDYEELTDIIAGRTLDKQEDIRTNLNNVVKILNYNTPDDGHEDEDNLNDGEVVNVMTWYENKSVVYINDNELLVALEKHVLPGEPKVVTPTMPTSLYNVINTIKDKLVTFNKNATCVIIGKTKTYNLRYNLVKNYYVIAAE